MMLRKIHTDHYTLEVTRHNGEVTIFFYDENESIIGVFGLAMFAEMRDLFNIMWDANNLWEEAAVIANEHSD